MFISFLWLIWRWSRSRTS